MRNLYKYARSIVFCLAILPAILLGVLILKCSVNVPFADEWLVAVVVDKFSQGNLSFSDLIAQHNESRKFFPRLILLAIAYLTHWDVRYEMLAIFFLACLTSFNIYRLSRLTVGGNAFQSLGIAFLSNLLIFSPIQYENWLWGIQVVVFIPIACITSCIAIVYSQSSTDAGKMPAPLSTDAGETPAPPLSFSPFPPFGRPLLPASSSPRVRGSSSPPLLFVIAALCTISTFSYANGILSWIVVFPVLAFSNSGQAWLKKKWLFLGWLAAFSFNAALYFYNYQKPSNHPSLLEAIAPLSRSLQYFLSFLGSPLAFGTAQSSLTVATIIGAGLMILLIAAGVYLFIFAKDAHLIYLSIGWGAIAAYTLISALITTVGRVSFGVEQALSSRYTTFSVYLIVALIHLLAIIFKDFDRKTQGDRPLLFATRISTALMTLMIAFQLLTASYGVQQMYLMRQTRLEAKACLQFFNIIQNDCLYRKVFAIPNMATFPLAKQERIKKKLADVVHPVDKLGFIKPGLIKSKNVRDIQGSAKAGLNNYGWLDAIAKVQDDVYQASGWAILPNRKKPADIVILTYDTPRGESIAFTLTDIRTQRIDVANYLDNKVDAGVGWQKDFTLSGLPKGSLTISAWAFDAHTGKAFKLNGERVIRNGS